MFKLLATLAALGGLMLILDVPRTPSVQAATTKINATIPPTADAAKLTLEEAVELLAAKSAKGSTGKKRPPAKVKGPKRKAA